MRILSTKQQYEAINNINIIKNAILSGNEIQTLNSIENLAELTYIIGGMKELVKNCPQVTHSGEFI
jgi:hypothetical protein